MLKSKYLQSSSLAGYGVIMMALNQIFDINELGAVGQAVTATAQNGGDVSAILVAAVIAGLGAILKDDKK